MTSGDAVASDAHAMSAAARFRVCIFEFVLQLHDQFGVRMFRRGGWYEYLYPDMARTPKMAGRAQLVLSGF